MTEKHSMSVDWHNNAQRAKQTVWVVKIYEHECVTDKTRLLSETGAPTEEIAHSWAKVTIDFWSGESARIPEANGTFFVPDVYLVPQKVYTYSILEQHN